MRGQNLGVLITYVDRTKRSLASEVDRLVAGGAEVVWDSGAFSVFTGVKQISVAEHTEWVLSHQDRRNVRYVGLDVIGDPTATLANYREQRAAGAKVEPTIHYGTPLEQVDDMMAVGDTDWINIGGIVGQLRFRNRHPNIAAFVAAVRRRVPPEVNIHALGCTTPSVLGKVRVDAVDSSSWLAGIQFGVTRLFDPRTCRFRLLEASGRSTSGRNDWRSAHELGRFLRTYYDVAPDEVAEKASDRAFMLTLSMKSMDHFADRFSQLYGRPFRVYLAGDPTVDVRPGYMLPTPQTVPQEEP